MELKTLLTADYLDIVFDRRNKKYGGYELRRNYNRRLKRAAGIVLTTVAAALSFSFITINKDKHIAGLQPQRPPIVLIQPPAQPAMPKVIPPAPKPDAKVNTKAFTAKPEIAPDKDVPEEKVMPKVTELANAQPGISNAEGPDIDPGIAPAGGGGKGTGVVDQLDVTPTIHDYVQQMPQFPGDINAYLSSHLSYPEPATENNIAGNVVVRFVVNENGMVSNAVILKGIGGGCNEEALRMINAMPRWKPGKQNGVAVKVYFSLSIKFVLHE